MPHDTIIVLDFGSQYAQLIARRVREQAVYSELVHWNEPAEKVLAGKQVKGFILSGGPASVYEPGTPASRLRAKLRPACAGHMLRHATPRPQPGRPSRPPPLENTARLK